MYLCYGDNSTGPSGYNNHFQHVDFIERAKHSGWNIDDFWNTSFMSDGGYQLGLGDGFVCALKKGGSKEGEVRCNGPGGRIRTNRQAQKKKTADGNLNIHWPHIPMPDLRGPYIAITYGSSIFRADGPGWPKFYQRGAFSTMCGVHRDGAKIECWSDRGNPSWSTKQEHVEVARNQMGLKAIKLPQPGSIKSVIQQSTCNTTAHQYGMPAPMRCTSCPTNIFHTILNPTFNTGLCTKSECPGCRPRTCCGKVTAPHNLLMVQLLHAIAFLTLACIWVQGHKHFVLNAETLDGVCVRMSDDCTSLCVPRELPTPGSGKNKPNVCSKGCNQWHRHGEMEMVVCQSEKRVVCQPNEGGAKRVKRACHTNSWTTTEAVCEFRY